MATAYPLHTRVATPTGRSAQTQARIEDLATKVFTSYELQKIRSYMPNIQFKPEEAALYKHNIIDEDKDLKKKLQEFVANVYIYDILINLMRDINERVHNATSPTLIDTSREKIGAIVTLLRGFMACEPARFDINNVDFHKLKAGHLLWSVYLHRIPFSTLSLMQNVGPSKWLKVDPSKDINLAQPEAKLIIRKYDSSTGKFYADMESNVEVTPSTDTVKPYAFSVFNAGPHAKGFADCIFVFQHEDQFLHKYNTYSTEEDFKSTASDKASLDSKPAEIIPFMFLDKLDGPTLAMLAPAHYKTIASLMGYTDIKAYDKRQALPNIPNHIKRFIRRDLLAFNRLRSAMLNHIDAWWRNAGALSMVKRISSKQPWESYSELINADYRVSGLPQPSCGPGYGSVFLNADPASVKDKDKLRVVDPYIVSADGSVVENPNAVYGPVCARAKGVRDLFGGFNGMQGGLPLNSGVALPNFHAPGARRVTRRRTTGRSKRRVARR
eukprot:jgi/Mesvir1/18328/Mv18481-RA.1